jgi:hypothetical protein
MVLFRSQVSQRILTIGGANIFVDKVLQMYSDRYNALLWRTGHIMRCCETLFKFSNIYYCNFYVSHIMHVFTCVMYVVSRSAFVGKYIDMFLCLIQITHSWVWRIFKQVTKHYRLSVKIWSIICCLWWHTLWLWYKKFAETVFKPHTDII